jgi:hypothetical protein
MGPIGLDLDVIKLEADGEFTFGWTPFGNCRWVV